jgi:anti-anti-sigma factor
MKFQVDLQEKYALVSLLEEKLDSIVAPKFKSELLVLNAEGVRNLILDLSHVKYVDSSGLSALLIGNRLCQNQHGIMILCHLHEQVEKLIVISQLDKILNILPTQMEATEAVFLNELEGDFLGEEETTVEDDFLEDEIEDPEEAEDWEEDQPLVEEDDRL